MLQYTLNDTVKDATSGGPSRKGRNSRLRVSHVLKAARIVSTLSYEMKVQLSLSWNFMFEGNSSNAQSIDQLSRGCACARSPRQKGNLNVDDDAEWSSYEMGTSNRVRAYYVLTEVLVGR
jgi:hypothetical protein